MRVGGKGDLTLIRRGERKADEKPGDSKKGVDNLQGGSGLDILTQINNKQ